VQRPIERDVLEIEADDPVERGEGFGLEGLEDAGGDPLVPAGAQGRVGDLVVEDRFDVDPRRTRDQPDQQAPEAQPARDAWAVTTKRMAAIRRREQRLDRRPDRIDYLRARMMCRDLHRSSWAAPGIKTGAPPRPVDGPLLSAYPRES